MLRKQISSLCVVEAFCSIPALPVASLNAQALYEPTTTADFAETPLLHNAVAKFLYDSTFLSFSKMRCQDRDLLHNEILSIACNLFSSLHCHPLYVIHYIFKITIFIINVLKKDT